ncbi:hypothetical protein BCV70DRAFT_198532 [Testicularia cyperi]|uniref:Nuclear speckle splicing regulatory protein 1 N-terminal domain-containing protein n=1 Tax=Testicularia cyperi TaxID=1882483 RepID=A0A317XV97_9BASI|nr:hypothetical protein BCV70DRAFT_198532 [Testicularia cyperi]
MSDGQTRPKLSFGFTPNHTALAGGPAKIELESRAAAVTSSSMSPNGKPIAAFGDDEEQDHPGDKAEAESSNDGQKSRHRGKKASSNRDLMGLMPGKSATPASRADRKRQEEAASLDASVFDYDSVYDTMKQAEQQVRQVKMAEDAAKKPKYVEAFLESAEQRKRDRVRAEAKILQKQRQAEGDEFADKEVFVTSAYKEQQAQLDKAAAQEEEQESQPRDHAKAMTAFYRDMINNKTAAREAAIAASLKQQQSAPTTAPSGQDSHLPKVGPKSRSMSFSEAKDAVLATPNDDSSQPQRHVEVNDDGQVVDNRDLLSRGLNIISKRRDQGEDSESGGQKTEAERRQERRQRDKRRQEEYEARMHRDERRARQSALIEEQMLELERKRKLEDQSERDKDLAQANARRNDQTAISDAKQRFLERKRKKLQQQQHP